MKQLFLAASFSDVAPIFAVFSPHTQGKRITFIPTASVVEKVTFYVKAAMRALEKLGAVIDVLDLSSATKEEIDNKLRDNDFIYISGGNTFYLLQEMKRTGADQRIVEEVTAGKLLVGESAGAIVTAPNIEYAKRMDSIRKATCLSNFDALGLVDFYPVPHYTNPPFQKSAHAIVETYASLNLKPISNHEAILVQGDSVKIEQCSK